MLIVKPYGRSHTEDDGSGKNKRVLRLRPPSGERRDIEAFAATHDELVIAQWISTIDKIATKPSGKSGATPEQRAFRERLGDAAWAHLVGNGLLRGLGGDKPDLAKLWKAKIAPYGRAEYKTRWDRKGTEIRPPSPKGRWYGRFAGSADVEVADVDAEAVAAKIHEHLYEAEYRICPEAANRRSGRIAARARSIAHNVLRPTAPADNGDAGSGWGAEDRAAYVRAGNVARAIQEAARQREDPKGGVRRVTRDVAGKALFDHYARLFPGDDGKSLSISDAKERYPGLFNLHMAVKDCYSRVLKHHKKDQKAHGEGRRRISTLLPGTMDELFALVDRKGDNRDLNALIRLGKIIHYEASGNDADRPADVVGNWSADVALSRYWTSDGQAEIKRNEAFVRVWRHVLALANRTLKDWADPDGHIESDILLAGAIHRATGELFDSNRTCRKLDLLFGNQAESFKGNGDAGLQKRILKLALEGTAQMRHGSFHFKGLGGFARALDARDLNIGADVRSAIGKLWVTDLAGRIERLRETMRAAHFADFFDEGENRNLFDALSNPDPSGVPLPRFRRILQRADNAWSKGKDDLGYPKPANRADLEDKARLCQYTALKLVYERPFRRWLSGCETEDLNAFIDRAVVRATAAARDLNAKSDEDRRAVIVAKAAGLGRLAQGDYIQAFFFNLSAATASEMRVQRGYDSDSDRAREQAGFIENLKCDVLALAFADFLKQAGFDFLLKLSADARKSKAPPFDLDQIPTPDVMTGAEDWQLVLYFLIHLVPVEEIGKLLHQMRKWEILAGKPGSTGQDKRGPAEPMIERVQRVQATLGLYLDMHDAKFEGGAAVIGTEDFKGLFATAELFSRVFPQQTGDDDDRRVPRRGLREIMRFGHLPALRPIFEKHTINADDVEAVERAEQAADGESEIARCQEARESLHEKWSRERKDFTADDLRSYVEALKEVSHHRHLSANVTLTNHVRLHRLMMAVLGRLVDFSGLWERDLYFVTLALIDRQGRRPADILTENGLAKLQEGQIVAALRKLKPNDDDARIVKRDLCRHFGAVYERRNANVGIRNDFAHFNMLRSDRLPVDITACVNDARRLMAYDRKLKNAVPQSIKELLDREGLTLEWAMAPTSPHRLEAARLATGQARHLGKAKLIEKQAQGGQSRPRQHFITENLHGAAFVEMAAALFSDGEARKQPGLADLDPNDIDWEETKRKNQVRGGKKRAKKPQDGNPSVRNRNRIWRKPS